MIKITIVNIQGWEDETDLKSSNRKAPAKSLTNADRKAQKKMKAELLQEKTRVLKPMAEKISEIESAIEQLESEFRENTELLVKASNEGTVEAIAELPKKNGILRRQIDHLYEQLEEITSTYEKESLEFQKKLKELK